MVTKPSQKGHKELPGSHVFFGCMINYRGVSVYHLEDTVILLLRGLELTCLKNSQPQGGRIISILLCDLVIKLAEFELV